MIGALGERKQAWERDGAGREKVIMQGNSIVCVWGGITGREGLADGSDGTGYVSSVSPLPSNWASGQGLWSHIFRFEF